MLKIKINSHSIEVGELSVSFERTLRIPDDDHVYPLPPSLGSFPICRVEDYKESVPPDWLEKGGVFIPMYQREAMWLSFNGSPHAVMIDAGKINAVSGKKQSDTLEEKDQNYLVSPDQPWLDGFNAGEGFIRQFVAMPLGQGYTVEEQLSPEDVKGGMRLVVFAPKPGAIPEDAGGIYGTNMIIQECCESKEMGLAAGGKMEQEIYEDDYGIDTWDTETRTEVPIHVVNSEQYEVITGKAPPETLVTAETYTDYGYPWYRLYNEEKKDITASKQLAAIKSMKQLDKEKEISSNDPAFQVSGNQIISLTQKKQD